MKNPFASQGGFTLVEMTVIIVMIGILSMLIFANTQTGNRRQQLRDAASQYVSAAKQAESLASGSEALTDPDRGGQKTSRKAYGVCITSSQILDTPASPNRCGLPSAGQTADTYQIYGRDLNETSQDDPLNNHPNAPEIINTFKLPNDFSFVSTDVWLDFVPPAPSLFANGGTLQQRIVIAYKDLNLSSCVGNKDCREVYIRPLSGAVYAQ